MSAPTAILQFGATSGMLANNVKRNLRGLDSGTQQWFSGAHDTYSVGDALGSPFAALFIKALSSTQDGNEWVHDMDCIGLLTGDDKREDGYPQISDNLEAVWDEITDSFVTTDGELVENGDQFGSLSMYCVSRQKSTLLDVATPIYRITPRYKGFISEKLYKRVITVNAQIVTPGNPVTVDLPGGWGTPYPKGQVSMPKIVVRDTLVTTVAPPTDDLPGSITPPDPPTLASIVFSGDDLTRHWPNGWVFTSIENYDRITGTDVYMYTLVYEYQLEYTP